MGEDRLTWVVTREVITVSGVLRDRRGVVLTLGDRLDVGASFTVETGDLPPDYDASWSRDASSALP